MVCVSARTCASEKKKKWGGANTDKGRQAWDNYEKTTFCTMHGLHRFYSSLFSRNLSVHSWLYCAVIRLCVNHIIWCNMNTNCLFSAISSDNFPLFICCYLPNTIEAAYQLIRKTPNRTNIYNIFTSPRSDCKNLSCPLIKISHWIHKRESVAGFSSSKVRIDINGRTDKQKGDFFKSQ